MCCTHTMQVKENRWEMLWLSVSDVEYCTQTISAVWYLIYQHTHKNPFRNDTFQFLIFYGDKIVWWHWKHTTDQSLSLSGTHYGIFKQTKEKRIIRIHCCIKHNGKCLAHAYYVYKCMLKMSVAYNKVQRLCCSFWFSLFSCLFKCISHSIHARTSMTFSQRFLAALLLLSAYNCTGLEHKYK